MIDFKGKLKILKKSYSAIMVKRTKKKASNMKITKIKKAEIHLKI